LAVLRWSLLGAFVVLLAVRLVLGLVSVPRGFEASYWSGTTPNGPPERSTEFLRLPTATRIDPRLDFRGDEFPVHFFNDAARFNFGPDAQPGRDQLPFSVRWTGALDVGEDGARQFVLDANGPARVLLDGVELLSASGDAQTQLSAGTHALQLEYTRPEARVPRVRLSWQRLPGGDLEVVHAQPDVLRSVLDALVVLCGAAAFGVWVWQKRAWLALLPALFLGYGIALQAPLFGRATILSGLDDWLIYESSARDILLNGLLMNSGQEHAAAYYGQPLYPYVLAVLHLFLGEGLFGPLVVQFAALGLLLALAYVLARRAFDVPRAAVAALAALWLFMAVQNEYLRVARQLFNENLYMPLVMVSLIALVSVARLGAPPPWWRVLLVGVLLGVTAISRSQFLAFVPLALVILGVAWRRPLPVLVVVFGLLLAVAPVTARNWVVSGQFVPISASGGASLLEFHRPPPGLVESAALQRDPLFEALHLDTSTRTVLAFARADPFGYLATWLPLGAHSIGLPGRTAGAGVYWPLLLVVVLYVAAFALPRVRRRHVWPIHGFVASHLLVLMLFEADTYGYRLVMPMYAPMLVVAAQVPLALARWLSSHRFTAPIREGKQQAIWAFARGGGALVGLVVLCAVALQARALLDAWPDREASLLGLGGPAAHAAATADRVGASAIYVASVDGTPRHFGAGSLPGLRYPWFKWFDPARSVPLPASGSTAVYALSELANTTIPGDLVTCLGAADSSAERVITGAEARAQCTASLPRLQANFEGVARVDALQVPTTIDAGDTAEARLVWEPLQPHPEPHLVWLHLEDADTQWGNATLDPYPAQQWQPGETILSRLLLKTDVMAIPDQYQLTLGMSPTRANAPPVRATAQGVAADRVTVATVALAESSTELAMLELPPDMLPIHGVAGAGLELVAARPPVPEALPGARVRLGLLWRALDDAPKAAQFTVRLVREGGEVVQETELPLLAGRRKPSTLHAGAVVRDEAVFEVGPRVAGLVALEVRLDGGDAAARVGEVKVAGREHVLDTTAATPRGVFGQSMALLIGDLEPAQTRAGGKLTVHLRWRAEASMERSYKIFVHVLDSSQQNVVAQRDAEPLYGKAPTAGWLPNELVDDELQITLPSALPAGEYPVEVGVYEERSGERLRLASGDSRVVLDTRLQVR